MIGRYGQDELNRVLSITGLIADRFHSHSKACTAF